MEEEGDDQKSSPLQKETQGGELLPNSWGGKQMPSTLCKINRVGGGRMDLGGLILEGKGHRWEDPPPGPGKMTGLKGGRGSIPLWLTSLDRPKIVPAF